MGEVEFSVANGMTFCQACLEVNAIRIGNAAIGDPGALLRSNDSALHFIRQTNRDDVISSP